MTISRHQLSLQHQEFSHYMSAADVLALFQKDANGVVTLDRADVRQFLEMVRGASPTVAMIGYVSEVTGRVVSHMLWCMLLTFGFMAMVARMKVQIGFVDALRVTVVASTPMVWLDTASLLMMQPIFVFEQAVYLVLHLVYLYLGASAIKQMLLAEKN